MKRFILSIYICGFLNALYATEQEMDYLLYNNETLLTPGSPLETHTLFREKKIRMSPSRGVTYTHIQRGYIATWHVQSNKLFLVKIKGWIIGESKESQKKATLELIFPDNVKDNRVFADWYSGPIEALRFKQDVLSENPVYKEPRGKDFLLFHINKGVVTNMEEIINFQQARSSVPTGALR